MILAMSHVPFRVPQEPINLIIGSREQPAIRRLFFLFVCLFVCLLLVVGVGGRWFQARKSADGLQNQCKREEGAPYRRLGCEQLKL